jgi:hypothetical protein
MQSLSQSNALFNLKPNLQFTTFHKRFNQSSSVTKIKNPFETFQMNFPQYFCYLNLKIIKEFCFNLPRHLGGISMILFNSQPVNCEPENVKKAEKCRYKFSRRFFCLFRLRFIMKINSYISIKD